MPKVKVLPHPKYCLDGTAFDVQAGTTVLDALLEHGIELEHACEKSCACSTCHLYIREGFDSLSEISDQEDDFLEKAWGLEPDSRLSCQSVIGDEDLVIEIPKYTLNQVGEKE
ncbi:MAG: ISC system 2Fe-2S type ferredoxin [Gammaproteobacteria bacterium]|nr:MAG: ISC system 2Fe-2S type ferredoxin [Gammaproteobacteria bacterium]